jgi:hypothetical protein
MKAIILSIAAGILLFIVATLVFRIFSIERRARALFIFFVFIFFLLVLTHLLTPADLGILPNGAVTPISFVDLLFAAFLYTAGFMGGVIQIYNLADRGLSLRIIIDIFIQPSGKVSARDVMKLYGGGHGIEWMYDKRLHGMLAAGLIQFHNDVVQLTTRGQRAAKLFAAVQNYARINSDESRP